MATTDDSIKKNISQNITKYREKAGLSQKELAARLNTSPSRVSNWEQGANCPTIDMLFDVCKILNISINDIYGVYPETNTKLTYDEKQHLEKYRDLDPHGKRMVDFTLQEEWERLASASADAPPLSFPDREPEYLMSNAAHRRTDIEIPEGVDTSEDDIMDDENF